MRHPMSRGVTLIELMISLGVIAALIAITVPALSGARISAAELRSLSNARQVSADMQAYADRFGHWPFSAPGTAPPGYQETPPAGYLIVQWWPPQAQFFIIVSNHWQHSNLWPGLVAVVAPWEEHYETWISPGAEPSSLYNNNHGPETSYLYSNSFVGSPALWSGSAPADSALIAPMKPADVAHPANKVLVWDASLAYLPQRPASVEGHLNHLTPMAFADGHAAVHNPLDAAAGVPNPLNNNNSDRLHNTPGGVQGRDY